MLPKNKPYLIGETAFHHEGDISFLKTLIEHGSENGIDAIKFHLLLNLDDYIIKEHAAYDVLDKWIFDTQTWTDILNFAANKSIELILLCNDVASIKFAIDYPGEVKAIELHATGLNDYFLLENAAKFKGTVILGVGGSTIDEIQFAIDFLLERGQSDIFLMYGFQNYPTKYEDINLRKMDTLGKLFNLPIGYADHTDPKDPNNEVISILPASMGYNILEKHFSHEFGKPRTDAQAAISLTSLKNTKELLTVVHTALGEGNLKMSSAELSYGDTGPMKKAIVARRIISNGSIITMDDIAFKRTVSSAILAQKEIHQIIGSTAKKEILEDEFIDYSNIKYEFKKADISQFFVDKEK